MHAVTPRRSLLAVLATLLVGVSHLVLAQAMVPDDRTEYELPNDGLFPEGVAVDEASGTFFVSGAGAGGIYRVDLATGEATEFLAPGTRAGFTTIGMDVDDAGHLWVAGGGSGEVLVFDIATGEQVATFTTPTDGALFLNDVIVTANGDAFITDSNRPVLWRVPAGSVDVGSGDAEAWLSFEGTAFEYVQGFNANGIAATADGETLIVVSGGTGALYSIDVGSQTVTEITVGEAFPGGDGLVLDGQTLYVVQNGADRVAVVTLSDDFATGTVDGYIDDDRLTDSATAALVGDKLLVVNAQFSAMQGTPSLPFTVSVLPTTTGP
jgi:Cu-Zn family superoxide dismutase